MKKFLLVVSLLVFYSLTAVQILIFKNQLKIKLIYFLQNN